MRLGPDITKHATAARRRISRDKNYLGSVIVLLGMSTSSPISVKQKLRSEIIVRATRVSLRTIAASRAIECLTNPMSSQRRNEMIAYTSTLVRSNGHKTMKEPSRRIEPNRWTCIPVDQSSETKT